MLKQETVVFKKKTSFIIVFFLLYLLVACFCFVFNVSCYFTCFLQQINIILSLIFLHYLCHPHHHHQYGRFALKIVSWIYYLIEDILIYLSCCLLVGLDWIELFEAMVLYLQYCCMMMMLIIKMTN